MVAKNVFLKCCYVLSRVYFSALQCGCLTFLVGCQGGAIANKMFWILFYGQARWLSGCSLVLLACCFVVTMVGQRDAIY